MRELKFRVWSEDQKTYDYKFPYNSMGDFYVSSHGVVYSDFGNTIAPEVRQKAFIVEQYTGLKDKNGKEIYEGDIVRDLGGNHEVKFCEMKDTDCSYFYQGWGFDDSSLYEEHDFVEVIGNIHENAELLEHKG